MAAVKGDSFAPIPPSLWDEPWFKEGTDAARLFKFYLITCKHGSPILCYHLPLAYVAHDIGRSSKWVTEALNEAIAAGRVMYDQGTHPNGYRYREEGRENKED